MTGRRYVCRMYVLDCRSNLGLGVTMERERGGNWSSTESLIPPSKRKGTINRYNVQQSRHSVNRQKKLLYRQAKKTGRKLTRQTKKTIAQHPQGSSRNFVSSYHQKVPIPSLLLLNNTYLYFNVNTFYLCKISRQDAITRI